MFEVWESGGGWRARCEECGHVERISREQAAGDEKICCEECGITDYA